MAVAAPEAPQDYEVIDLDTLTFEQLCDERVSVKAEIDAIDAQLKDERRKPVGPPDFSHEWVVYHEWRARARWALVYKRNELQQIKALLRNRNKEMHKDRIARLAALPKQETVALSPEQIEFRKAESLRLKDVLLEALKNDGDPSVLLLRMYRAIRRLLKDGELPAALDAKDIATIRATAEYLGGRYGRQNVGRFAKDQIEEVPS